MVQYGSQEATDLFALETVVSRNVASRVWNQGAGNNRHLCIWLEAFPEPVFILLSQSRISEQKFAFYDWDGNLESYGILCILVYTGSCILESWMWMYFDSPTDMFYQIQINGVLASTPPPAHVSLLLWRKWDLSMFFSWVFVYWRQPSGHRVISLPLAVLCQ